MAGTSDVAATEAHNAVQFCAATRSARPPLFAAPLAGQLAFFVTQYPEDHDLLKAEFGRMK